MEEEIVKQESRPRTSVDTDITRQRFNQNVDNNINQAVQGGAIPSEALVSQQQPLELAQPEPLTRTDLIADQEAQRVQASADLARTKQQRTAAEQSVIDLSRDLGQEGRFRQAVAEREGLTRLEDELDSISAEIRAENQLGSARLLQAEQDVIGTGVTTGFLSTRLSNRQRDNAIRSLVLGAQADVVQGNVNAANRRVERAVDIKFEPIRQELGIQKFNLDRLDKAFSEGKVDLTNAEKQKLQLQLGQVEKEEKDVEQAEALTTQILKNQPSQSVRDALIKAKSVAEINAIPGISQYLTDPLDRQLKNLNIAKSSFELNKLKAASEQAEKAAASGLLTEEQDAKATELRKELNANKIYSTSATLEPEMAGLLRSLSSENGVGDIAAINSFQRLAVDPGVAVREGDVSLLQSAQSFGDKAYLKANGLIKGDKLTDKAREQMKTLATDIYEARINYVNDQIAPIRRSAETSGIDFNTYVATPFSDKETLLNGTKTTEDDYINEIDTAISNSGPSFLDSVVNTFNSSIQ